MSVAKRSLRPSDPNREMTWCVLTQEHDESHARAISYHETFDEAHAYARELLDAQATASTDEMPYVFVCKIHEQNGDK